MGQSRNSDVLLVSCYESGFEPRGIAVPARLLRRHGVSVALNDLATAPLDEDAVAAASLVAISVPMHTALRLGVRAAQRVREVNPDTHICFYGTYAELCREALVNVADSIVGTEFEDTLLSLARRGNPGTQVTDTTTKTLTADFDGLAPSGRYVRLVHGDRNVRVGAVASTRGCKHTCRHCPVPAVYDGRFYAIDAETVLADIDAQVARGIGHVSFTDPDFLNGPTHALRIARRLHDRHPDLTFDYTAKVQHLLHHRKVVTELARLGNLFVISAVESLSDVVLDKLDKGHTRHDVVELVTWARDNGVVLRPTFVPFSPWETVESYLDLLDFVADHHLEAHIDPVQLAIRLLVPPGSLLLDAMQPFLTGVDPEGLAHMWSHPDRRMDDLQRDLTALVEAHGSTSDDNGRTVARIREHAMEALGRVAPPQLTMAARGRQGEVPRLTEPWFC